MSYRVSGQMFGNLCKVCDFLQIGIAALIGEYRYRDVVGKDLRIILVFIHDGLRYLKQRDGTQFTGFFAVLVYPFVAVPINYNVGTFQRLNVDECQPRKAAEHESVAYPFKTGKACRSRARIALTSGSVRNILFATVLLKRFPMNGSLSIH